MTDQWLIYFLIFGAVFLGFQGLRGVVMSRAQSRRTAQRFATIDNFAKNREEVELLKKKSALADRLGVLGSLQKLIIQAGPGVSMTGLLIAYAVLAVVLFVLTWRFNGLLGIAAGGLVPAVLLLLLLLRKRARRIAKFGEQLPDVIDVIVRGLKAGHPLPVSLSLVGREMPAPAGPEFTIVFDEVSYGRDVREALDNLYGRIGHPDLKFLIASISISHQTGGNLGEILARLSKLIRDRFRIRRKIRALSAEGRAGGIVLSVVPILIFGAVAVLNPGYYGEFWGHPTQNMMMGVAGVLLMIGNLVIYKIVNFKV